jgi:hypothetical protein
MTTAVHPDQLTLPAVGNKWLDAYEAWKARHPEVFRLYLDLARVALRTGKKFSVSLLTEQIRWRELTGETQVLGDRAINNNFRAYIARDLIAAMPELAGVLVIRAVEGDEA